MNFNSRMLHRKNSTSVVYLEGIDLNQEKDNLAGGRIAPRPDHVNQRR